jgi:hypothetical protein
MKNSRLLSILSYVFIFSFLNLSFKGCGCGYSFSEKSLISNKIKTVRINTIENRAPYVNPQLTPSLTERIRQKIIRQTKLIQTNNEKADYDISGTITDYAVSTTGVTSKDGRQQTSINRLMVTVNITLNNQAENQTKEFSVSRSFDFSATQSLQAAEAALLDEMVRNLSDEIFNRIFSDW